MLLVTLPRYYVLPMIKHNNNQTYPAVQHSMPVADQSCAVEMYLVVIIILLMIAIKPVRMSIVEEFAATFAELADRISVVLDHALHVAVFLQHVGGPHLITSTILADHVQLLLAHPRLRLRRIEEVLQSSCNQHGIIIQHKTDNTKLIRYKKY